jgi:hypothetical protein
MSARDLPDQPPLLPARWFKIPYHPVIRAYWNSPHRFNTVPAGRRSYKTETGKRRTIRRAMTASTPWEPRYFLGAPTRDQAKRIFWEDLKALSPKDFMADKPSESELTVYYINGAQITVVGLDVPARIEGSPWDGGVLTEIANMKPEAWTHHVRPALADRKGWCDLEGVPEGRNHYYEWDRRARALMKEKGAKSLWGSYHWKSSEVLSAEEIEQAKQDLDELTFDQEYNASFINFEGRAYYPFEESTHCDRLSYNADAPLILCFDFNVEPGVAAIIQEQKLPGQYEKVTANGVTAARMDRPVIGTGVIGEVYIPRNSSTPAVCRRIEKDWGKHRGQVYCYGDATGGARGSAKVEGSDWEIISKELKPVFGERLAFRVKEHNPKERARINAVNTRLKTKNGTIHLMVDGAKAPHVVTDLEGVTLLKGGSGEIDKKKAPMLTHISDAIGYYVEYEFPVMERTMQKVQLGGI